jgi:hypothetical protein
MSIFLKIKIERKNAILYFICWLNFGIIKLNNKIKKGYFSQVRDHLKYLIKFNIVTQQ